MFRSVRRKGTRKRAFTLIELLVVVAIIGILATIAVVAFSSVQIRARDTRRLADAKQIINAIKLYREQYGVFPPIENDPDCSGWDWSGTDANSDGNYMMDALVTAGIMSKVPRDPLETGGCIGARTYHYHYYRYPAGTSGCDVSRGAFFVFTMNLERDAGPPARIDPENPGWTCPSRDWSALAYPWVTGGFTD